MLHLISSSLQPQWYRIIRTLAANFEEHCFGSAFLGFDLAKGSLLAVQIHFAYLMSESRVILCIEDTPDNLDEVLNWESDQRLSFIFDVCIQHSNLERWYQELEQYVRNTTHTSNDALTASAVYPPYLSLHEIFVSGHFVWRSL